MSTSRLSHRLRCVIWADEGHHHTSFTLRREIRSTCTVGKRATIPDSSYVDWSVGERSTTFVDVLSAMRSVREGFGSFARVMDGSGQRFIGLFLLEIWRCREQF